MTNSSLVDAGSVDRKDIHLVEIDADSIAYEIGSKKIANIIIFAAYMTLAKTLPIDMVHDIVMKKLASKPELLPLNEAAFAKGVEIAKKALGE